MGGRDDRVDELLAAGLADAPDPAGQRWLCAGALERARGTLQDRGATVVAWHRYASEGPDPRPAPPDGPFAGAVLRPWRGSDAARMGLHLAAAQLAPDGVVWAAASNDEGGRSLGAKLLEALGEVDAGTPGRRARRYLARRPRQDVRGALEDWREAVALPLPGGTQPLASWPGLFAHGRLDPATALLLEHLPDATGARVLDFAAGAGAISAALRSASSLDLCDHDALACHAAVLNVPGAAVHCVDGLPRGGPWDLVVSNPPIHRGSDRDLSVLRQLGAALPQRVAPGGEAWLVTQATVAVPQLLAGARSVATDRRFTVWRWARATG
ncbi:MAG: methyltransferase [Myxococcota bacterium]